MSQKTKKPHCWGFGVSIQEKSFNYILKLTINNKQDSKSFCNVKPKG